MLHWVKKTNLDWSKQERLNCDGKLVFRKTTNFVNARQM